MSQLLCEQVVGRGVAPADYDLNDDGKFDEEVAQVLGVPFEVVPFKATGATPKPRPPQRRVHAVPQKAQFAITVPQVLGYSIGVPTALRWIGPAWRGWCWTRWPYRRTPIWRRC